MNNENEKILAENLAYLKSLDINKINKTTHLAHNRIINIIEKNFDKIDKIHAKGFISILEREYKLDLSYWLQEYNVYHSGTALTQKPSEPKPLLEIMDVKNMQTPKQRTGNVSSSNALTNPKNEDTEIQSSSTSEEKTKEETLEKDKEDSMKSIESKAQAQKKIDFNALKIPSKDDKAQLNKDYENKKRNDFLVSTLLIILSVCLIGYSAYRIFFYTSDSTMPQSIDTKSSNAKVSEASKKTEEPIFDSNFMGKDDELVAHLNTQIEQDEANKKENVIEPEETKEEVKEKIKKEVSDAPEDTSSNAITSTSQNIEKDISNTPTIQNLANTEGQVKSLTINTSEELWVGVVNLDAQVMEKFSIKSRLNITLAPHSIVIFGHPNFDLLVDKKSYTHSAKKVIRLYYDGNEIREITYNEYIKLYPKNS